MIVRCCPSSILLLQYPKMHLHKEALSGTRFVIGSQAVHRTKVCPREVAGVDDVGFRWRSNQRSCLRVLYKKNGGTRLHLVVSSFRRVNALWLQSQLRGLSSFDRLYDYFDFNAFLPPRCVNFRFPLIANLFRGLFLKYENSSECTKGRVMETSTIRKHCSRNRGKYTHTSTPRHNTTPTSIPNNTLSVPFPSRSNICWGSLA